MSDRWDILHAFVNKYLARPLDAESGNTQQAIGAAELHLEASLPRSVREWYQLVGCRPDVTCFNDRITQLPNLNRDNDGFVSLYWESQMIWDCGIRTAESNSEDPPAYFKSSELDYVVDCGLAGSSIVHESLVQIVPSVSSFLTYMAILQRLIGCAGTDWKPEIFYGTAPCKQSNVSAISEFKCIKVFEVPWGHSLYTNGTLVLEGRTGNFITSDDGIYSTIG